MALRLTLVDFLEGNIPEDRRFFFDIKFYGIPYVVNNTLRAIKERWPGCEGVSVCYDKGFPIASDIEDEQFRLEVHPLYEGMEERFIEWEWSRK